MKTIFNIKPVGLLLWSILFLAPVIVSAENEKAVLKLQLVVADSVKTCKATVFSNDKPVKDVTVKFFVKRLYSLLPIGKPASTNEQGEASVKFLKDLPSGTDGKVVIIAKLDDDPTYGTMQVQDSIKWGTIVPAIDDEWDSRSLSASRNKAPKFLIVASVVIIIGIWGTLVFVVLQLFRIRNISRKPLPK